MPGLQSPAKLLTHFLCVNRQNTWIILWILDNIHSIILGSFCYLLTGRHVKSWFTVSLPSVELAVLEDLSTSCHLTSGGAAPSHGNAASLSS